MAVDIALGDAARRSVQAWRVVDGALLLRLAAAKDERPLRCVCGRDHWIVETRHEGAKAMLAVKCHGCGATGTVPFAAGLVPVPS